MIVNGATSQVVSGVPQGSVLDPLLFIIYVNSLCYLSLSNCSELVMYADDLILYKPISSESDWIYLQNDISTINGWVEEFTFNTSKCKCMLLTRRSSRPISLN